MGKKTGREGVVGIEAEGGSTYENKRIYSEENQILVLPPETQPPAPLPLIPMS